MPEPGGPGGPLPPPIFGKPVNPIPTMGGRFCPPFTSGTPNVFHLPASLGWVETVSNIYIPIGSKLVALGFLVSIMYHNY